MFWRRPEAGASIEKTDYAISEVRKWFTVHVTLDGQPYTLDHDQARAVIDDHKNTLVTARAGSGKTRVIVAKVAYLVAVQKVPLEQIVIFMFNRTAAAEVNQRIQNVKVDHQPLISSDQSVQVASTFHKYALDIVKLGKQPPRVISADEDNRLVQTALDYALEDLSHHASPNEKRELLQLTHNFITRAGQKFPGQDGLVELKAIIEQYCQTVTDSRLRFYHQVTYSAYTQYLAELKPPLTNFNLLMAQATATLKSLDTTGFDSVRRLRHIMVDEYQDFSYLFFALISAIRRLTPTAKLFAVGDDWQAINRFAGSDVDYFLNFKQYFPEDSTNLSLATNYRSARKIVERANQYMLTQYDADALPARAFSHQAGYIKFLNPATLRFDGTDIKEDGLADGRFQTALAKTAQLPIDKVPVAAAQLLKQLVRIIKHHHHADTMLLHRHNFTSFDGITLEALYLALKEILLRENLMTTANFDKHVRCMTMHKSKGLESEVVILLEMDATVVASCHPHATIFQLFGDNRAAESADQKRLLYVAMTRAKKYLYVLSQEKSPII